MIHKSQKINSGIFSFFLSVFIFAFLIFRPVFAQTTVAGLLPPAVQQFFDNNGNPLSSGKVYFYDVGTTTFKNVYNSSTALTPYPNPITLNAGGKPPGGSGIYGIGLYRQVVKDKNGNVIWDAVTAPTGSGGSTPTDVGDGMYVGFVMPWSGFNPPNQYVYAYGQELNRTDYSALEAAITLTTDVICSSGSNVLTGLNDTTQIPVGAPIEVTLCAPAGTVVTDKTSSTVTMSNSSGVSINTVATFFPWGNGNGTTTFNVPDLRSVVLAGRPNMGGSDRGLITSQYYGTNPNGINALGGNQTNIISQSNLPNVSFNISGITLNNNGFSGAIQGPTSNACNGAVAGKCNSGGGTTSQIDIYNTGADTASINTDVSVATQGTAASGGTGAAFSIIQPTTTINYVIKAIPDTSTSIATGVYSIGGMVGAISCGSGIVCSGNIISAISSIANQINIGQTNISGGTSGKVIYDNAGVVDELPTTGTGSNLVLADSPNITINSVPCTVGESCTITAASGMVVGSTTITGGSNGDVFYNNAGVLGATTSLNTLTGATITGNSGSLLHTVTSASDVFNFGNRTSSVCDSTGIGASGPCGSLLYTPHTTGSWNTLWVAGNNSRVIMSSLGGNINPSIQVADTNAFGTPVLIGGNQPGVGMYGYGTNNTFVVDMVNLGGGTPATNSMVLNLWGTDASGLTQNFISMFSGCGTNTWSGTPNACPQGSRTWEIGGQGTLPDGHFTETETSAWNGYTAGPVSGTTNDGSYIYPSNMVLTLAPNAMAPERNVAIFDYAGNLLLGANGSTAGFSVYGNIESASTSNSIVLYNAGANPTNNPRSGAGILFVLNGALKYKGSSGTVTQLAPP